MSDIAHLLIHETAVRLGRFQFAAGPRPPYFGGSMASAPPMTERKGGGFGTLLRFLPMLWPKGETELKARVIAAVLLVLLGKGAVLLMPFAYKAIIDRMSAGAVAFGVVAGIVVAYSVARFAGVF